MDNIFLPKETKKWKGKKKLRPPDWLQFKPPAGQETDFFYGQPYRRRPRLRSYYKGPGTQSGVYQGGLYIAPIPGVDLPDSVSSP